MTALKKFSIIILLLFTILSCFITVYADEIYTKTGVYDFAELLTEQEEKKLQKISNKYYKNEISVIFLTTKDTNNKSLEEYANNFYINKKFFPNSIMFIISKDPLNHQLYIYPTGVYIETLSKPSITEILESTKGYAMSEEYYEFFIKTENEFSHYIKNFDALIAKLKPSNMSIAISFSSIVCVLLILFNIHNKANVKPKAQIYLNQSFKVINSYEIFLGDEKEVIKDYYKKDASLNSNLKETSNNFRKF